MSELRRERDKNWWWADNSLIDDEHIKIMTPNGWAIYCMLLRHADAENKAFPSLSRITDKTGLTRPTVISNLSRLIKLGYVERISQGTAKGKNSVYRIKNHEQLVKPVNQLNDLTSKTVLPVESPTSKMVLPELVKPFNQQLVKSFNPKNTNNKNTKEETTLGASGVFVSEGANDEQLQNQTQVTGSDRPSNNTSPESATAPLTPSPLSPSAGGGWKHPASKLNDRFHNPESALNPYWHTLAEYDLAHIWVGSRSNELNAWHPAIIRACQKYLQSLDRKGNRRVEEAAARTYLRNLIADISVRSLVTSIAALQERAAEAGLYDLATSSAIHRPTEESEEQQQESALPNGFQEWWELAYSLGYVKSYQTEGFPEPNILLSTGRRHPYSAIRGAFQVEEMRAKLQTKGAA